jgi:hypothetical protein
MAATIFGFTANEIKPQPGFNAQVSDNGGWTATHEFAVKASDFASVAGQFAKGSHLITLDPSIPAMFDFLQITETAVSRIEGDLVFLSVTATGTDIDQWESGEDPALSTAALPTYSLRGALTERPILSHPKIIDLENPYELDLLTRLLDGDEQCRYNSALNQFGFFAAESDVIAGPATENITQTWFALVNPSTSEPYVLSAACQDFAKRIAKGDTTYQVPSITWTETTEGDTGLNNTQLNKLGKISTPRGNPPAPGGSRNWLLTSATSDQQGLLYRTQLEWTLSDENGWDAFFYD